MRNNTLVYKGALIHPVGCRALCRGLVGAWEIHTPTLAACATQEKLHFPCDSLRCLPFSALAESKYLASQAIHFPQA